MGSGHAGGRGIARLSALCAVLFGLFLMHGAPAAAAEGCHGAMSTMAASPMTGAHHPAPLLATPAPAAHGTGPTVRAADASAMSGTLCVSTAAHERIQLPAPGLLGVAGAAVFAPWVPALRVTAGGTGRRGPPGGGRDLLLQVCIART
ncbi:hypothetical protein [Streptomyces sp. NPDC021562]|uniref:hypothetical protein n=1 Tax=Streptomyces sp. NPDC021562 TaxID=3155121 RepID=UPI0010515D6D